MRRRYLVARISQPRMRSCRVSGRRIAGRSGSSTSRAAEGTGRTASIEGTPETLSGWLGRLLCRTADEAYPAAALDRGRGAVTLIRGSSARPRPVNGNTLVGGDTEGDGMRQLLRWSFNLGAAVSAILFVATCVLWARSYEFFDTAAWATRLQMVAVQGCRGELAVGRVTGLQINRFRPGFICTAEAAGGQGRPTAFAQVWGAWGFYFDHPRQAGVGTAGSSTCRSGSSSPCRRSSRRPTSASDPGSALAGWPSASAFAVVTTSAPPPAAARSAGRYLRLRRPDLPHGRDRRAQSLPPRGTGTIRRSIPARRWTRPRPAQVQTPP